MVESATGSEGSTKKNAYSVWALQERTEILKATKCPPECLKAASHFRCKDCEYTEKKPFQHNKVSMPMPYIFNHTIGKDVDCLHDFQGQVHMLYNIVGLGTGYQMEV